MELHGMVWPDSIVAARGEADAVKHVSSYVNKAAKHLPGLINRCVAHKLVIQAGGHCGAWPRFLSRYFTEVHTWEPDPENFACLTRNVPANVVARPGLLGRCDAQRVEFHHNDRNSGGHRAYPRPGTQPVECIDDFDLRPDAIVLDIEGMELPALQGAERTLRLMWPVIMIEDRSHGTKYGWGEALPWLEGLGYRVVAEAGWDKILEVPR